jgi:nitroreductase
MEFEKVIFSRRSIRKFLKKEVEDEKIRKILEVINSAPSAGDLQAYEVFLIRDENLKEKLSEVAYGQHFIAEAPIVFVFFANPRRSSIRYGERGKKLYCIQDATIAASYLQLSAVNLGLGSVWVGAFDDEEVKRILKVNKSLLPIAIIPVGYPAEKPDATPRRKLTDLIKFL